MSKATRIQDCIDHHDEYILTMASMPDRALVEKLDTIHLQMTIAEQQGDTATLELLEVWRAQTIEARTYKAENEIPDAEDEIALAIADIETYITAPELPSEIAAEALPQYRARKQHQTPDEKSEQLSMF
ncbi:MAG: hypothetical protein JST83_17925 [Bacteroidetes bacterium]|nr:hypothetical protein [Bacteroidota bacterium]